MHLWLFHEHLFLWQLLNAALLILHTFYLYYLVFDCREELYLLLYLIMYACLSACLYVCIYQISDIPLIPRGSDIPSVLEVTNFTLIIYFDALIALKLASGSPSRLVSVSIWHLLRVLWARAFFSETHLQKGPPHRNTWWFKKTKTKTKNRRLKITTRIMWCLAGPHPMLVPHSNFPTFILTIWCLWH